MKRIKLNHKGGYGPGGQDKLIITKSLSQLQRSHNKYITNLSVWKQYLVWRYTIGSGSINKELIGIPNDTNKVVWVYQFFRYYNYDIKLIEGQFSKWKSFYGIRNASSYMKLADDEKIPIATKIIQLYIESLQKIILRSPPVEDNVTVFKVAAEYPQLPSKTNFEPKQVLQLPFNSTSYDPQFDYELFMADNSDCCFFVINIPKGSQVLCVPKLFHAYPFENEIMLPFGCTFDIFDHKNDILDYIPKQDVKLITVQKEPYMIGPVYELDPAMQVVLKTKPINIFLTNYINP